jgi:hypothetical protein
MSHADDLGHPEASIQRAELHDDAQRVALAWRSLRRGTAARKMRTLAWAPDPPQLDIGQIDSLDLLVRHRSWTMCEFATALGIDPSTATRAIGRLIEVGLAERHTCATARLAPTTKDERGAAARELPRTTVVQHDGHQRAPTNAYDGAVHRSRFARSAGRTPMSADQLTRASVHS